MEAISHAGTCVGVLSPHGAPAPPRTRPAGLADAAGIVLATEKKVTSALLESKGASEKMYRLDGHMAAAVAGLTADVRPAAGPSPLTR